MLFEHIKCLWSNILRYTRILSGKVPNHATNITFGHSFTICWPCRSEWINKKAKLHCLKAAPLPRESNLLMSCLSPLESIFWLLHLMLVEAECSQNFLVELWKSYLEAIVRMPQTSKILEQGHKGLGQLFPAGHCLKNPEVRAKAGGRAHLKILPSHFLVVWGFGEHSFAPVLPRNFISYMLGKDAPIQILGHQIKVKSYMLRPVWGRPHL